MLHPTCGQIFRRHKDRGSGEPLRLHTHQEAAVRTARAGHHYVLTTGTGSGKSLSYIVPIVDHVLRRGSGNGIQAIIVYPMNALVIASTASWRSFSAPAFPMGAAQSPLPAIPAKRMMPRAKRSLPTRPIFCSPTM